MYNIHVMMNTNDCNLFAIFSLGQEDIACIFDICIIGGIGLDELYNHRTKKLTHEFMRRRNYEEDEEDSGMVNSLDS